MFDNILDIFQEIAGEMSPAGYENRILKTLASLLDKRAVTYIQDSIGNLFFKKRGKMDKTILIVAHCDEIGFIINYIDDNGFIFFRSIGNCNLSILKGQQVMIAHNDSYVLGVIGVNPLRMIDGEDNVSDISDLWIDIGASSKADAEKVVSIGDSITFVPNYQYLSNGLITTKSADNRISVSILLSIFDYLADKETNYSIVFAFSAQEEVGRRGANLLGHNINPDICIVLDVTYATDYPFIRKHKYGDIRINSGAVIPLGSNFSSDIQQRFIQIAMKNEIPFQIEAVPSYAGTDIEPLQISNGGCYTGQLSIPCRYMHSPVEVVSGEDVQSVAYLLSLFCLNYS